nr:extensin-like [Drosophila kikkawai]
MRVRRVATCDLQQHHRAALRRRDPRDQISSPDHQQQSALVDRCPQHGLPHRRPLPSTLNRSRDDRRCGTPRRSRRRTPESKPLPGFRTYPARPQSRITGAGPLPCDPAPPLEAKPPPTEQPGARQSLPPRRVKAVLAPLLSPPPLEQSAQQPRDLEITAAPNASQHLDEKPPPTEQPGARYSLPPSGVKAVLAPSFSDPPPEESADSFRSYSLLRSGTSPPCPGRVSFRAPPPKKLPEREPCKGSAVRQRTSVPGAAVHRDRLWIAALRSRSRRSLRSSLDRRPPPIVRSELPPPPSPTGLHRRRLQKERNRSCSQWTPP